MTNTRPTGLDVPYYSAVVQHPWNKSQAPYVAECDDVADALRLTPYEKDIFKEIWRTANARLNNGKPDHTPLYGAEKIFHRAQRILESARRVDLERQGQTRFTFPSDEV